MTHFFFNVRTQLGYKPDTEGMDLPDLRAAVDEAHHTARQLAADMLSHGQPLDGEQFELTSQAGELLIIVRWIDVVEFEDVYLP